MEEKKVPALRFRGFDNAWEQRRATDIFVAFADKGYPELPVLSATQDRGMIRRDENSINIHHDKKNEEGYKRVLPGQFVIHLRSFQGGFAHSTIEGITSPAYIVFGFAESKDHCSEYWKYIFVSEIFIKRLETVTYGIRDGRSISYDEFLTLGFVIPYQEEQIRIAQYLKKLDHLIFLHQRKLEMLKKVKKSMLEKMFPKNDAKVPELRFSDFTDAWEQRKLGELSEKTYGGGTPSTANAEYWCGNIPWLQSSDIIDGKLFDVTPKKYISQVGLNSSAAQLIPENSIAIITRVGVGKLAFLSFFYTTSQDFLSMSRLTTEPYFTVYACYKKLQSELNSVQGTSIKGITKDELLAKEIKVPSYDEQKQIGEYFTNLDRLITLHQRKLEKLKNIKKSMLEKMFII